MQLWIWRHLRIVVPDDWEMLQFARDPAKGRCAFADRTHFRLELTWQAVAGPPDFERMMSDYVARLRVEGAMAEPRLITAAGWPGIEGTQDGLLTRRFGKHVPEESLLVEVVLIWPEEHDSALEADVLSSMAVEPADDLGLRRWRAFGMDMLASDGLAFHDCRVEPARARMGFEGRKTGVQETFERLGMVDEWLHDTVGAWLRRQAQDDIDIESEDSTTRRGHTLAAIAGRRRTTGVQSLFLRPAHYEAAAWRCPTDGRLYRVTTTGEPPHKLAGGRLACCPALEAAR
jgi:hypothetical protein